MTNLLFGTTRASHWRSRSSVDDSIGAGVRVFLGVGRITSGLRGRSVGDTIAASFDGSLTILNIKLRTWSKNGDQSPISLLIQCRLASFRGEICHVSSFLVDHATCCDEGVLILSRFSIDSGLVGSIGARDARGHVKIF